MRLKVCTKTSLALCAARLVLMGRRQQSSWMHRAGAGHSVDFTPLGLSSSEYAWPQNCRNGVLVGRNP